ncbi:MAG: hypothetical protein H6822_33330 [Planctomycetaceae bacterium]|nr:hypothetical protein [Planctomycetales bacterium]MCB9927070.1 hypothetical protein [Planctomycetaceae bacterium]
MSQSTGIFGLSIDFKRRSATELQGELSQLLKTLQRFQVPATFATSAPGCDGVAEKLRGESLRHELAILADNSWVGPHVGRTHFARELAQRVEMANAHRATVRTLAITDSDLSSNLDLLVKHRISVVRSPLYTGFQPQSLRFGVWQAPISFTLPSKGRWQLGGTEWAINRALTRASRAQGLVHLVVDLETLRDRTELATLERILATVHRRRSKGQVATVTMQGLVARLAPQRQAASGRSVLRVA